MRNQDRYTTVARASAGVVTGTGNWPPPRSADASAAG